MRGEPWNGFLSSSFFDELEEEEEDEDEAGAEGREGGGLGAAAGALGRGELLKLGGALGREVSRRSGGRSITRVV